MRLSVILVNYNGMRYLDECLQSIRRFAPPETEVILVDNASTDGSADFIARQYPWVRLIRSPLNLGFSAGNNLAGSHVQGKCLLLLNADTVLLEPISEALDWLEVNPTFGALTINMIDGERIPQACTGRFPSPLRLTFLRTMLVQPDKYGDAYAYPVDWVQGSFLLMRSEMWRTLGGLDESHFMYLEDVDLCKRIYDNGFKCAYLPGVRYLHWGGYSAKRFPDQTTGLCIYISHHTKGLRQLACLAILWFGCLARVTAYGIKASLTGDNRSWTISKASWQSVKLISHSLTHRSAPTHSHDSLIALDRDGKPS